MKCVTAFCHEDLPLSTRGGFELCTCEGRVACVPLLIAGLLYDYIYKCGEAALNDPIGLLAGLAGKRSCSIHNKDACCNNNGKRKKSDRYHTVTVWL